MKLTKTQFKNMVKEAVREQMHGYSPGTELLSWVDDNFRDTHGFIVGLSLVMDPKEQEALKQRFEEYWAKADAQGTEIF